MQLSTTERVVEAKQRNHRIPSAVGNYMIKKKRFVILAIHSLSFSHKRRHES